MGALILIGSGTGPHIRGGKILSCPSLVLVLNDVCSLSHPSIGPMLLGGLSCLRDVRLMIAQFDCTSFVLLNE